jgi:superfamily II DNA or RNA helicase
VLPPAPDVTPAPSGRTIRLRPWQQTALRRFEQSPHRDFLAMATPGAGKTTFALTAAIHQLAAPGGPRRLIVVAPTAHLKRQWAVAAAAFGIHLDPMWSARDGLARDMHGIVTTYQQVAVSARALAGLAADAMVVFDEIHHAGDDRAWGEAVRLAFAAARRRLSLSGTPFRSDTRAIPFLRYELEEARPDYEYGYGEALRDGRVVRPVYFPRTTGDMEWSAPDGTVHAASFDDPLDQVRANQRLRTALSVEGEWLPTVLGAAHRRLTDIRRSQADAGGLVIATDQDHARAIAASLERRFGVDAAVATSDDDGASDRISAFARSAAPWLVAVRMVSEGVDIPRLRVGVYATTTTTELFFRQAVGRLVRWTVGVPNQRSYLFIPDDSRLRARAFQIAEVRRHTLRRETTAPTEREAEVAGEVGAAEQMSLFAVISAVATATHTHAGEDRFGEGESLPPSDAGDDGGLTMALPALARRGGPEGSDSDGSEPSGTGPSGTGPSGTDPHDSDGAAPPGTRRQHKERLRDDNARLARALARKTGWPHAQVNAELNRLVGLRGVTEATVQQLEKRKRHAERWYTTL